jgi:translation elongation factor P/translation initiation factor 5A
VSFEVLSDSEEGVLDEISSPSQNMETVILESTKLQFIHLKGNNFGMMP